MRANHLLPIVACLAMVSPLRAQTPTVAKCDSAQSESNWQPRCMACHAQQEIPPGAARWHMNGGASFYSLQPFFNNNAAYNFTTATTQSAGNAVAGLTQFQQFGWTMQPAFDAWVDAISPSGLGIRARYFHLDGVSSDASLSVPSAQYGASGQSVIAVGPSPYLYNSPPGTVPQQNPALAGLFGGPSPFVVNFPGAPPSADQFTFRSELRLDAIDLEATGAWHAKSFVLSGGLGGRYFHMTQSSGATLINRNAAGASLSETLDFNHAFQGGGPTVSGLFSWHPLHPNFSLFAGGRASIVVGQSNQTTSGSRILNDPTGAFNPIGAATSSSNNFFLPSNSLNAIPIAELELGMEYAHYLRNSTLFARGAVVDQTYFGAGNASRADGNLSLLGFKITGGIAY